MKKAVSVIVLFLFLLSFPVSAASGKLSAASVSGKIGDQVTVSVRLDNPGIIAMRIFVRYDSAVLRLDSAENGEIFAKGNAVFGKDIHADPYTMLWDDSLRTENITTSGTLCTLQFTILKAAANGETNVRIAVDRHSTLDFDLNEVAVTDATCIVNTGGGTTAATTKLASVKTGETPAASSTTTGKASSPAASPTAASASVSTTKAAASIAADKLTTASRPTATAAAATTADATTKETKTTSVPSKPLTAADEADSAAASTSTNRAEENGTTAATATQTVPDTAVTEAVPVDGTLAETQDEADLTKDLSSDTTDGSGVLTTGSTEEPKERHVNLLWLLVLVPVAAVLLFVIFKKKK